MIRPGLDTRPGMDGQSENPRESRSEPVGAGLAPLDELETGGVPDSMVSDFSSLTTPYCWVITEDAVAGSVPGTNPARSEADDPNGDRRMTGRGHRTRSKLRSLGYVMGAAAGRQIRALIPPITPRVILRALFGILLFLCGILFGLWLLIRFRRRVQDSTP
jgi:hypothetical protein